MITTDPLETLHQQEYTNRQSPFYQPIRLALDDYNSGRYHRSLEQLKELRKKARKRAQEKELQIAIYINIGNSYARRYDLKEATNFYEKVLKIDPNHLIAKNNLMLVFVEQERYPEATSLALELEKRVDKLEDPIIFISLGRYYAIVKRDLDKCLTYNLRAINQKVKDYLPYNEALFIYEEYKKDYKKAFEIYESAASIGLGDNPSLLNNYAYALLKYGDPKKAYQVLRKIDLDAISTRDKVPATATWGLYYLKSGDLEKGREFYENAVKIADSERSNVVKQKYLLELGNYYFGKGDINEAEKIWEEALATNIAEKFYDYKEDILHNLLMIRKTPRELSTDKYAIKLKESNLRYIGCSILFVLLSLLFSYFYVLWKKEDTSIINPFYSFLGIVFSLGLFLTCIGGIVSNRIK